jgi:ethanolamine utilization protein EutJ
MTARAALLEATAASMEARDVPRYEGVVHVGVDLGTAYTVLVVLDEHGQPLAGAWEYAEVVRDGVVVDFAGASALVRRLKEDVERRLGRRLEYAATTYPPGIPESEVRATRYVLEAAGLDVSALVDEPTAANAVLGLREGAVVDVGGGTTGTAIVRNGRVIATRDDPTGGHHLTLVIAGALGIPYHQAEQQKVQPAEQRGLFHVVRPVLERIATIVVEHLRSDEVEQIALVGGTSAFHGFADVVTEVTGIPATVAPNPRFVTPLGVAMQDPGIGRVVDPDITRTR